MLALPLMRGGWSPARLMAAGGALLLLGAVLPFLMVLRVLEPGFALSFLSYAATVLGLTIGLTGVALAYRREG